MDQPDLHGDPDGVGDDRFDGADLCVCCLQELDDGCSQCPHCAAPVGPTAAIAPWERILSEGFIYRRAVAEPRRLIVVVGVCAVFSLSLLGGVWLLYLHMTFPLALYELLGAAFAILVGGSAIWQCVGNYIHGRS